MSKSLFDHIKEIKTKQRSNYFDTLSDEDKKTWSNYMVFRFLSMNEDYLPYVNYLQKYYSLPPHLLYKTLISILPKTNSFDKYIKGSKSKKYNDELVSLISMYFQCSHKESNSYLDMLEKSEVELIVSKYGKSSKEIKKLIKVTK